MGWRQAASAGALVLVALVALLSAMRLEPGTVTQPGPGFFPAALATALLLVSLALLGAAKAPGGAEPADAFTTMPPRPWALIATVGALAVYVALFERLGFVLATAALLAFLVAAVARYRLPVALGAAVAVALAARLVFDRWLQVRLPPDFWGR
jgi:putative tricarboxylic transport membrane protein